MKHRIGMAVLALALIASTSGGNAQENQDAGNPVVGAVYTASNGVGGNAVLVFDRFVDGRLRPAASFPTGGLGTGVGLGNQGGVVFTRDERFLLVVNAGSNSVSVFEAQAESLRLVEIQPSGGLLPVSVTEHRGLVYVLHAGSDNITGFQLDRSGQLQPLANSTRNLSGTGTAPAQIGFSPDGDVLVVTEKATNTIVTFAVDRDGVPGLAQLHPSNGITPFGFAFGKRDQLFVSEAFGGAAGATATSSYEYNRDGVLTAISGSVLSTQTAACWVALTPNGRYAYVTNTGSGSITGYHVGFDGEIALLDADGRTGIIGDGSTPIDLALTGDGQFVYSLNSGANTIGAFRVRADGSLAALPFAGLPAGANGLAVR